DLTTVYASFEGSHK
ncbi:hypothetical protein, partial [Klebsiella pneumoniae]